MNTQPRILLSIVSLVILLFNTPAAASASGSTFLSADLRIDQPWVKSAGDFRVKIAAVRQPSSGFPSYTAGWLGIDLDEQSSQRSGQPTRVGLMADQTGVYWFAFSEAPIRCLQGTPAWWDEVTGQYRGCKGSSTQIIKKGFYHTVELVNYGQDEWIARVFDTNEVGYDVAVINHPGVTIYDADINFEEAYIQDADPYLDGAFVFYRPQYNTLNQGQSFVDWPASQGIYKNTLYLDSAQSDGVCPTNYTVKTFYESPRGWYTGAAGLENGSGECSTTLFNELYIPVMLK